MKKKLVLLSMISVIALAGCGEVTQRTDNDGNNVIVKIGDKNYTANELFVNYSNTSTGAQQYFNAVYDVLVNAVQPETTSIKQAVQKEFESFIEKAENAAKENNTSSKAEISKALEAAGVEDEAELQKVYLLEKKKAAYEDKFYENNVNVDLLKEYINYYAPYHIRHILVKTSSGDSLYQGTISKDDANNIADVVTELASGNQTFGTIAKAHASNGDTGSANQYGDVGIMSTTTGFVSEFKYGIYQYDALYNSAAKANVEAYNARQAAKEYEGSALIPYADNSEEVSLLTSSINRIDYNIFAALKQQANLELNNIDFKDPKYKEDKYLPRNVIFNQYLNDHALGVIRKGDSTISSDRFQWVSGLSANTTDEAEKILCDEAGRPILVTRAGTGSGEEGYQGIHLIVIQKSPFVQEGETDLLESLTSYYDTKKYAEVENPSSLNSYVTFIKSTSLDEYTDRANELKSNIKAIDSYMNYRIYEQALKEAGNVEFGEVDGINIKALIESYMNSNRYSTAYNANVDYAKSWESYINLLKVQNDVESLKVSLAKYKEATGKDLI